MTKEYSDKDERSLRLRVSNYETIGRSDYIKVYWMLSVLTECHDVCRLIIMQMRSWAPYSIERLNANFMRVDTLDVRNERDSDSIENALAFRVEFEASLHDRIDQVRWERKFPIRCGSHYYTIRNVVIPFFLSLPPDSVWVMKIPCDYMEWYGYSQWNTYTRMFASLLQTMKFMSKGSLLVEGNNTLIDGRRIILERYYQNTRQGR